MKTGHDDQLIKALAMLRQTGLRERRATEVSSVSTASGDVGELFLADLQARREQLKRWIRLLSEEARLGGECAPAVRGSRYKCRGLALRSRAELRSGARSHSTAA